MSWIPKTANGIGFVLGAALVASLALQQLRNEWAAMQHPAASACRTRLVVSLSTRGPCDLVWVQVRRAGVGLQYSPKRGY